MAKIITGLFINPEANSAAGSPWSRNGRCQESPGLPCRRALCGVGYPESDIHGAVFLVAAAAPGGAGLVRTVLPAPPPADTAGTCPRSRGVLLLPGLVAAVPVLNPLPDVPAHVIEAEAVGMFLSHRVDPVAAGAVIPGDGIDIVTAIPFRPPPPRQAYSHSASVGRR